MGDRRSRSARSLTATPRREKAPIRLEKETRRCRETTDRLQLLGQPQTANPAWVDLNRAVLDTLVLIGFATRQRSLEVGLELARDLPPVWGCEGPVRGEVTLLCMNAVRAMPQGGRLVVKTSRPAGESVRFEVRDDSPGGSLRLVATLPTQGA